MSLYRYTATTSSGQRINGEKEAQSKDELVNFLYSQNLSVINIEEKIGIDLSKLFSSNVGGMPLNDKVILLKQLSTMVSANIPIIQAIDILVQQADKPSLKAQLLQIYKDIEAGSSLYEAFRRQKGILSEVHLNLLAAGEKSANLNEMLDKIAIDLEKNKNLRGKISGALIYPAIIFTVLIAVFVLMVTTMIPQMKDLYQSLGQTELPFVTQVLADLGTSLTNVTTLIILLIFIIAAFVLYKYLNSTQKGKEAFDNLRLQIPVFGKLIQKAEVAQFCRLMAMLLKSGLQIVETLDIVANASGNEIFRNIIRQTREEVIKGSTIALAMAKYNKKNAFPVILIRIIATGEEAGKLDKVLTDMNDFYESELDQLAGNLTKLMEPLIMIIAGGMVAFLAIAIYLPIFQVGQFVQS